ELHRYLWLSDPWMPLSSASQRANAENYSSTNERSEQGPHGLPLRRMEFEELTLHTDGTAKEAISRHSLVYTEDLGGGVTLDMVQIPGGSFVMGTTFEEASLVQAAYVRYTGKDFGDFWQEGPPHAVTVPGFY